nr:hypothetical protein [Nocardioides islandensis]
MTRSTLMPDRRAASALPDLVGEDEVGDAAPVDGVLHRQRGQLGGVAARRDGRVPDRHVAEHGLQVDVLERPAAQHARRDLPGERQHRRAVQLGVVQAGQQVRRAGSGDREAGRRAAGELAVGAGGEGRRALVPDPDVPQLAALLGPAHRVGDAQVRVADHAEDGVHPVRDQGLDDRVADGAAASVVGGQRDVRAVLALLRVVRRDRVREALRRLAGARVVVVPVPRAAQPAVLDRALTDRAPLVRAAVLQCPEPAGTTGERDGAAVDDGAGDPALGGYVVAVDPVPLRRHRLVIHGCSLSLAVARDCSCSVSLTRRGVTS